MTAARVARRCAPAIAGSRSSAERQVAPDATALVYACRHPQIGAMMSDMDAAATPTLVLDPSTPILTGEDAGRSARSALGLDAVDDGSGRITVRIPAAVVTSSFIHGLLEPSVRRLGLERFKARYAFEATRDVRDNIDTNVELVAYQNR